MHQSVQQLARVLSVGGTGVSVDVSVLTVDEESAHSGKSSWSRSFLLVSNRAEGIHPSKIVARQIQESQAEISAEISKECRYLAT